MGNLERRNTSRVRAAAGDSDLGLAVGLLGQRRAGRLRRRAPPEIRHAFEIMVEANEAAIAATRPGITLADVDRAAKRFSSGMATRRAPGRGVAAASRVMRPTRGRLKMDLRLYADVVLEPGMAFSLEPGLDIPGMGVPPLQIRSS